MRVTRVYVARDLSGLAQDATLQLEAMASAHLIKVLRLRAGAAVLLFCGDGYDYAAEIVTPRAEACLVKIGPRTLREAESPLRITLIQALCRGEKMDWVIEKATELGVHSVVPVSTERSDVQLSAERADKRRVHWQRIAISACEQCQRAVVPEIAAPIPLAHYLSASLSQAAESFDLKLALTPEGSIGLSKLGSISPRTAVIAVGPEGGFSPGDLQQLRLSGYQAVQLGPRVLRTESAGLAAISVVQARWGDFL